MYGQLLIPAVARSMRKASDSDHGGAPQQSAAPGVCMPPQPGTVSALGAHAPGPVVRAAVPTSRASCAAPQEPRLGTDAPAPPMSYASSTLDAGRHGDVLALGDRDGERDCGGNADGNGDGDETAGNREGDADVENAAREISLCPRRAKPPTGPSNKPIGFVFVEMPPQKPCAKIASVETAGGSAYVKSLYVGPDFATDTSPASSKYVCHPLIRRVSLREKGVDEMLTDA